MNKKEIKIAKPTKFDNDWMTNKWRPMMAIMYMITCLFDFVAFPVMFTIVQFWETTVQNDAFRQWAPITLQGGGLFHVAMGAVLGVTAWSRGQEKMSGVAGSSAPNTIHMPAQSFAPVQPASYTAASSWGTFPISAEMTTGFGGKPAPVIPPFPER